MGTGFSVAHCKEPEDETLNGKDFKVPSGFLPPSAAAIANRQQGVMRNHFGVPLTPVGCWLSRIGICLTGAKATRGLYEVALSRKV